MTLSAHSDLDDLSPSAAEEFIDRCAAEVAERAQIFAVKVEELALLFAGEPEEKVALLSDAVRWGLGDELTEAVADLFIQAVLRRKAKIERNAMPVQCQ
jgi:hypothetical protein